MVIENNKRIAKNTLSLYVRMAFMMIFGIISSKLTLECLGEEDYGIYNVVAGIIVIFQFFNSALTSSTQRFLNYYLGLEDKNKMKITFSQSLYLYIILSFIVFFLSETIGVWILNNFLNIPTSKTDVASVVYQISIFTTIFQIVRIPFTATIIAFEDMSTYAKLSIFEGVVKFFSIIILYFFNSNLVIIYALFLALSSLLLLIIYLFICNNKYGIVCFKYIKDKTISKSIMSFSCWNIFGSCANVFVTQSNLLLINHYFGVIFNASLGLATTINNAIYSFLTSFQQAFNPQVVKLYARNEIRHANRFCINVSKYSFMLIYFIILPFIMNCDFVLNVIYESVPSGTQDFIYNLIIFTIIDALNGPLWMLVEAEGNIKSYQIVGIINGIITIIAMNEVFKVGYPCYSGMVVKNFLTLTFMIYRLAYLHKKTGFSISEYIRKTILPIMTIIALSFPTLMMIKRFLRLPEIVEFILICLCSCVLLISLYYLIALSKIEKEKLFSYIRNMRIIKK